MLSEAGLRLGKQDYIEFLDAVEQEANDRAEARQCDPGDEE